MHTEQVLIDLPCCAPALPKRSQYVNQVRLGVPMKTNTSFWKLFRQGTATGLVLLLTVIGVSPVAEAGTWIRRDWSKVERIASGARTRVRLYKDRAPGGIQRVEGQFQSASAEAIMLLSPTGQMLTLRKQAVEKVLVYRAPSERYPGWITLGVATAVSIPTVAKSGSDVEPWGKLLLNGLFIGGPTVIAFLASPKWSGIYNVPRKLRDDPAPAPPPTATKQSSTPTALGETLVASLIEESSAERLRRQSRRAVMRQDLPLDLLSVPVHPRHTGFD